MVRRRKCGAGGCDDGAVGWLRAEPRGDDVCLFPPRGLWFTPDASRKRVPGLRPAVVDFPVGTLLPGPPEDEDDVDDDPNGTRGPQCRVRAGGGAAGSPDSGTEMWWFGCREETSCCCDGKGLSRAAAVSLALGEPFSMSADRGGRRGARAWESLTVDDPRAPLDAWKSP